MACVHRQVQSRCSDMLLPVEPPAPAHFQGTVLNILQASLQALTKGAVADAADALAAMATDDAAGPGPGSTATASNEADDASDMDDEDELMGDVPPNGAKRGKKRASEGFRQMVGRRPIPSLKPFLELPGFLCLESSFATADLRGSG